MPNPQVDDLTPDPIAQIFAENDKAKDDFFKEAETVFEEARSARLNPIADSLAKASADKPAPSSKPTPAREPSGDKPASPKATPANTGGARGKVPTPEEVAPSSGTAQAADAQTPPRPAPDFSDIAAEYKPGQVNSAKWKRLHEKADHFSTQADRLRKEVETLRARLEGQSGHSPVAAPEIQQQVESIRKERDDLQSRLESLAVERSPRFEAQFKTRIDSAINQAKAAVGPDQSERVAYLLSLPESAFRDEQIDAISQEMGITGIRAGKLTQAIASVDQMRSERDQMAQQGSKLYKQWMSEQQEQMARQQQQQNAKVMETFEKEAASWSKSSLLTGEGANPDAVLEQARNIFAGKELGYDDLARAALWAAVAPRLAQQSISASKRVLELEAELASLRAAQPNSGTDSSSLDGGDQSDVPANSSYSDAIAHLVIKEGLLRR